MTNNSHDQAVDQANAVEQIIADFFGGTLSDEAFREKLLEAVLPLQLGGRGGSDECNSARFIVSQLTHIEPWCANDRGDYCLFCGAEQGYEEHKRLCVWKLSQPWGEGGT